MRTRLPDVLTTGQENATFDSHLPLDCRAWLASHPLSLLEFCSVGPFPLWRRSLHGEIGFFDKRYRSAADYDLWLRAALKRPLLHVPEFLGLYWLNDGTVSRKGDLPLLEYLYVQKVHRPRAVALAPEWRNPEREEEELFRKLLVRAEEGDLQDGLRELEKFMEGSCRWPGAHYELGELCHRLGESIAARRHFEMAANLEPASVRYRERLQLFLESRLGCWLEQYQRELEMDPGKLETRLCAGMLCLLLERPEAALHHYRSALAIAPDSALARENLAAIASSLVMAGKGEARSLVERLRGGRRGDGAVLPPFPAAEPSPVAPP